MFVETELDKILKLREKSINELCNTREVLCEIIDRYFETKGTSRNWRNFYSAVNRCHLINNALLIKSDLEKENYLEFAKECLKWALQREDYKYAAKMRERIGFFKHSYSTEIRKTSSIK